MKHSIVAVWLSFLVGLTLGLAFANTQTTFVHNPYEEYVQFDEIRGYRIAIFPDGCAMITNPVKCKLRED